jgi:hypothetical protein
MAYITADELIAGSSVNHDVEIPTDLLEGSEAPARVKLRPLTVKDIHLISKAAKSDDTLMSALMLKEALVEPALGIEQVHALQAGVARHLLDHLNRISGLVVDDDDLSDAVEAPLARACFVLAHEFGWTPQEIGSLTMGQILLYLEMIRRGDRGAEAR